MVDAMRCGGSASSVLGRTRSRSTVLCRTELAILIASGVAISHTSRTAQAAPEGRYSRILRPQSTVASRVKLDKTKKHTVVHRNSYSQRENS